MRLLVIGGTRFVGKHVVARALELGHSVTLFHRGRTGADLFGEAEHLIGDRDGDLSALATGEWDATVDTCAYLPRQVHALADALGGRGGRHLLVSSVSVYDPANPPGLTEDADLHEPAAPGTEEITGETYGPLKVACELAAAERHGSTTLRVRPTFVVGPDDYTWRFPWWVHRIAAGGEVPVPGPPENPAQLIDGRDLAAFVVRLLEDGATGPFHAVGPSATYTWGELLQSIVDEVGPEATALRWLPSEIAAGADLGPQAFPLWSGPEPVSLMTCDPSRAVSAGLVHRPLSETIRDTLAWTRKSEKPDGMGVTPEEEAALFWG